LGGHTVYTQVGVLVEAVEADPNLPQPLPMPELARTGGRKTGSIALYCTSLVGTAVVIWGEALARPRYTGN
jgi:hypothetical protein